MFPKYDSSFGIYKGFELLGTDGTIPQTFHEVKVDEVDEVGFALLGTNGTISQTFHEEVVNQVNKVDEVGFALLGTDGTISQTFHELVVDEVDEVDEVNFAALLGPDGAIPLDSQLISDYMIAFGHSAEKASDIINQLKMRKLDAEDIKKIATFAKKYIRGIARPIQEPFYFRPKDYEGKLPRTMQYNSDGSIYILFNKIRLGDESAGKGYYKKVKTALNLLTSEKTARLSLEETSALAELEAAKALQGQEGIVETYFQTVVHYVCKRTGKRRIGYMQKFCNGGDVEALTVPDKNEKNYPVPTEREKFFIAERLLKPLAAIHQKMMLHRDIKGANFLLVRDPQTHEIKDGFLTDLGLACLLNDQEKRERATGTPLYMSPELIRANMSGRGILNANKSPTDNWGAGMFLYELFKPDIPEWKDLPNEWYKCEDVIELDMFLRALKNPVKWENTLPEPKDPNSMGHVIRDLLQPYPEKRISAQAALARVKDLMVLKGLKTL